MPQKEKVNSIISRLIGAGGKIVTIFTGLLAAAMILYSGYVLYDTLYIQNQVKSGWELMEYKPVVIDDGETPLSAGSLAEINQDYRAWLTVYDTQIDYPVMQGKNNLYYASHDYQKKSSLTGSLYLASENNAGMADTYNLIYGHHMAADKLFGALDHYAEAEYFNNHQEGVVVLSDAIYDLHIFATIIDDAYNEMIYTVGERDAAELVAYLRERAVQFDSQAADSAEKILAMSTCMSTETNGRLVVFAAMTERNADPGKQTEMAAVLPPAGNPTDGTTGSGNPANGPDGNANVGTGANNVSGGNGVSNGTSTMEINNQSSPLANIVNAMQPKGTASDLSSGKGAWALINLICVAVAIYLVLPLLHLNEKFGSRTRKNGSSAGSDGAANQSRKGSLFWMGMILEGILAVGSVVFFLLTENLHQKMILIDGWTPVMILIILAILVADLFLVRNRKDRRESKNNMRVSNRRAFQEN